MAACEERSRIAKCGNIMFANPPNSVYWYYVTALFYFALTLTLTVDTHF